MEPVSVALILLASAGGGALLAHARKKANIRNYGEISSWSTLVKMTPYGGQTKPSGICALTKRQHLPPQTINPYSVGNAPRKGMASNPLYQWTYVVTPGDTTGNIAEKITGDSRRYVEIVSANISKRIVNYNGEINFADLCVGEHLFLPRSMNAWIDETGAMSGNKIPFAPYNMIGGYPETDPTQISTGYIPTATGWQALPTIAIPMTPMRAA